MKIKKIFLAICIVLISCNPKNNKKTIAKKIGTHENASYIGEWFYVNKINEDYIYCKDISRSIIIDTNSIKDHSPMEDSDFKIDHIKKIGNFTYLYIDKKEISYYKFEWVIKQKGIAKWIFGNYEGDYFINKKFLNQIKQQNCEKEESSCELNNISSKLNFKIEASEYEDEENKRNPTAAWIIISKKDNSSKAQEIRFEPNSWVTVSNIPCNYLKIKDYNFDGLEDFSFIWDVGGNAGPLFQYFFQNKNGEFVEDEKFPLQQGLLPEDINARNKTLTTINSIGCCKINTVIYKLLETGEWDVISKIEELKE